MIRPKWFALLSAVGAGVSFILFVVVAPRPGAWWFLAGMAALACLSIYLFGVDRRRLGDRLPPIKHKWLAMLSAACAAFLFLILVFTLMSTTLSNEEGRAEASWGLGICTLFFAIMSFLLFSQTVSRRSGKRRPLIRRKWLAALAALGVVLAIALSLVTHPSLTALISVVTALAGLSSKLIKSDRRLQGAPEVIKPEQDYVIYLRSFVDENRPFAIGPVSKLSKYTDKISIYNLNPKYAFDTSSSFKVALDDYLGSAVSRRLGKFVALGNPTDRLPPPGAIREYAPDSGWAERFLQLAAGAKCVLVASGQSINLNWELEQMKQTGLASKLFFLTRPQKFSKGPRAILKTYAREREGRVREWDEFSALLTGVGFRPALPYPGPGSVITIDSNLQPMVLTIDAELPEDFVNPIANWVDGKAKTGKSIKGTCSICGEDHYFKVGDDLRVCTACKIKKAVSEMGIWRRFFSIAWGKILLYVGLTYLGIVVIVPIIILVTPALSGGAILTIIIILGFCVSLGLAFAVQKVIRRIRRGRAKSTDRRSVLQPKFVESVGTDRPLQAEACPRIAGQTD